MARYKPNLGNAQLAAVLLSPRLATVVNVEGKKIAAKYASSVPVSTGRLKSSVSTRITKGGRKNDRFVCRVSATGRHAAPLEFGYTNSSGQRVPGGHYMARAAGLGGE